MGISLTGTTSALRINEIMYDPSYNENYNEWIELYNEGEVVDLGEYVLCESALLPGFVALNGLIQNNEGLILETGAYALVSDGGSGSEVLTNYAFESDVLFVHVDSGSICGGLNNKGETIPLNDDLFSYAGGVEPGFSVEWTEEGFVSSLEEGGTPGRENTIQERTKASGEGEREPIRLSSAPLEGKRAGFETYITPEGKVRRIAVYLFGGLCIVITFLVALKRL